MIRCRAFRLSVTLVVTATVSHVTSAQASSLHIETAPARVRATSFVRGDFYVRAGAVLAWLSGTRFEDKNCSSETPAALYGCGTGVDGEPLGSAGNFSRTACFELGFGYAAAKRVRIEAAIQYHPKFSIDGRATFCRPPAVRTSRPTCPPCPPFSSLMQTFPDEVL